MKNVNYNGVLQKDVQSAKSKFFSLDMISIWVKSSLITLVGMWMSLIVANCLILEVSPKILVDSLNELFKIWLVALPVSAAYVKVGLEIKKKKARKRLGSLINAINIKQGMVLSRDSFEYCVVKTEKIEQSNVKENNATFYMLDNQQKLCVLREYKKELLNKKKEITSVKLLEDRDIHKDEVAEKLQRNKVKTL